MRATRLLITMCCALAIATMLMVTGARADEYTKLTYLTFSAPVQVPGMTLPAGTYMFKLADPEGGRRAIQIWDEKGTKLFTMLLTIPDEQREAKDDPVVLFSERPSGAAQAVKSWFYPAERTGYEFIYPKNQAMKIAAASNTPVLSYDTDVKSDADENSLRGAQVGRLNGQGQAAADSHTASTASTTTASTTTASAPAAPSTRTSTAASNTSAPAASTTTTSAPDANRTSAPAAASATPSTTPSAARSDASTAGRSAVGTSGQVAQSSQPARRANQQLPRTASPLAALQLLSAGLIVGALGVRQVRRRYVANR